MIEKTTTTKWIVYLPKRDAFYTHGLCQCSYELKNAKLFNRYQDALARQTIIEDRMYKGPGPNALVFPIDLTYEVRV